MSKRYSNLFSLPEQLYSEGSPVIIAAGALLKDNESGKVLAQLKLKNIYYKSIKAATVIITPYDTVGNPLGEPFSHQYLDLAVGRDSDFATKIPILLPNPATRSFAVSVKEVIFQDKSVWNNDDNPWEALSPPTPLGSLGDKELIKQFRLTYGASSQYLPLEEKDLWHCTCGAINRAGNPQCPTCQNSLEHLKAIDLDRLREERDKRLEQEAQEAAERKAKAEARKAAAAEQAKKAAKKSAKIGGVVAAVVVVAAIALAAIWPKIEAKNELIEETQKQNEWIETYSGTFAYSDWYDLESSFEYKDDKLYWICSPAEGEHPLACTINNTGEILEFFTEPALVEANLAVDTIDHEGHSYTYNIRFTEDDIHCWLNIDGERIFNGCYERISAP